MIGMIFKKVEKRCVFLHFNELTFTYSSGNEMSVAGQFSSENKFLTIFKLGIMVLLHKDYLFLTPLVEKIGKWSRLKYV